MEARISHRRVGILFALALLLLVWGVVGFFDRLERGRGGFTYFDYTIEYIERGGAAEQAGLRVGDRVVSVEGISVEDLPLYSRWPRDLSPRAGETLTMVVERDGELISHAIVYQETRPDIIRMRLGGSAIGMGFLLFCMWPILTVRTPAAGMLARIGLVAGLATFGIGPYLGTWDGVASHIQLGSMVLLTALVLQFFLHFPEPKPIASSRFTQWLIFGPLVLLVGCLVVELIYHPRFYHSFGGLGMMLPLAYCLLAFAAIVHTLLRTPMKNLGESGLGWILIGLMVAIGPTLLAFVGTLLIPGLSVPGFSYFPLLLIALPFSMAMAVRRQANRARMQPR